MFPFPVVDVPVPLVAGILLFPLVAGDTTARGGANASWRELQLPPRGRAAAATSLSAWRGRLVSASVPVVDVPVPPRGGGYDRSRTRKRVPAGVTTPSARAHRLHEGAPPPRGHTPAARAHSLREGTPPPRGPWAHSVRGRAWAGRATRPREQVSPRRGFRCAPRGRTRGWRAPGLPHQQPSAPSRCHPAATTVRSRHEGSRHRGQSR